MKKIIGKIVSKKENIYLTLALFFGLIMVFFNPPFAGVPDEGAHQLRALALSEGNFSCSKDGQMNKAAMGLADELKPYKENSTGSEKISMGKIQKALLEKDTDEKVAYPGAVCGSNPLGYLPQVIGIKLGDVLGIPKLWGFYFARLFNLLAATFITYLAIRIIPFGKIVLMVIALLPMTVQQYASVSYDPLHFSMIFLFIAYILKLATKEGKLEKRELINLGVLSIVAANVKFGFFPILFLLFTLPKNKFKDTKAYVVMVGGILFVAALLLLLMQGGTATSEGTREGVYPAEQLMSVINDPLGFVYVVFNTIYDDFNFFFETFLYKPGWLRVSLSPLLYVFMLFGIIVLIRNEDEEVRLSKFQRLVIFATFLASLLFVFFSMYVIWSKVGGQKIQGVQGRYFLSFFPLLILSFYKSGFNFKSDWIKKHYQKLLIVFMAIVFFFTFLKLWNIYYDKGEANGKYGYVKWATKEQIAIAEKKELQNNFQQEFLSAKDDLFGFKFYLQKGTFSGKGNFYLKDAECKNVLRQKQLNWNEDEFGSIEVKFGAIADSKNEKYCLIGEIESDPKMQIKMLGGIYKDGKTILDGATSNSVMTFDLIYKN